MAYRMAGITGVNEVVLDPPANSEGIRLYGNGYITLWGGCYTDLETLSYGIKSTIKRLAWFVRNNNIAHTLVKQYGLLGEDEVNYAAAALAMRTHGEFDEH